VKDLKAGETISPDAVRSVRPGFGLPPKMYDSVVGKTLTKDINANTPVDLKSIRDCSAQ